MTLRGSQKDGEGSREYFGQLLCFDTLPAPLANAIGWFAVAMGWG